LTKLLPLITEALLVCVLRNAFVPDIQLSKNTVTSPGRATLLLTT
jgi:hypothetical protein